MGIHFRADKRSAIKLSEVVACNGETFRLNLEVRLQTKGMCYWMKILGNNVISMP